MSVEVCQKCYGVHCDALRLSLAALATDADMEVAKDAIDACWRARDAWQTAEIARLRAELAAAQADLVPLRRLVGRLVANGSAEPSDLRDAGLCELGDDGQPSRWLTAHGKRCIVEAKAEWQRCIDAAKEAKDGE